MRHPWQTRQARPTRQAQLIRQAKVVAILKGFLLYVREISPAALTIRAR